MPSHHDAELLDSQDTLLSQRDGFTLPDKVTYLDGNSLGALAEHVPQVLNDVIRRQWGEHLIRAWNDDQWWSAPLRIGDRIGRLVGAAPGQITVGESTSVQLFNALVGAARMRPDRKLLVTDPHHFPTDRYLAHSVARLLGLTVLDVPVTELSETLRQRGTEVAIVTYGMVDYRTGELWNVAGITAEAHAVGAVVVWDLCHAVGAIPIELDATHVDVAVGCTYKYLSGGPGSPAFIYLASRHHNGFEPPLTGWHGHARPFAMEPTYEPAPGITRTRIGTPPVLSLLTLEAALDIFDGIELADVRAKSLSLSDFFLACVDDLLAGLGFDIVTPREHHRRGSQMTVRHHDAYPLMSALIDRQIIGDVRPPNLLRFGFNALYVSHVDVHHTVSTLRELVVSEAYQDPRFQVRKEVT